MSDQSDQSLTGLLEKTRDVFGGEGDLHLIFLKSWPIWKAMGQLLPEEREIVKEYLRESFRAIRVVHDEPESPWEQEGYVRSTNPWKRCPLLPAEGEADAAWRKFRGELTGIHTALMVVTPALHGMGDAPYRLEVFTAPVTYEQWGRWRTQAWPARSRWDAFDGATFEEALGVAQSMTESDPLAQIDPRSNWRLPNAMEWMRLFWAKCNIPRQGWDWASLSDKDLSRMGRVAEAPDPPRRQYEDPPSWPVRSKAPNAWGLYDMVGSVWEWLSPSANSIFIYRVGGDRHTAFQDLRPPLRVSELGNPQRITAGIRLVRTLHLPEY